MRRRCPLATYESRQKPSATSARRQDRLALHSVSGNSGRRAGEPVSTVRVVPREIVCPGGDTGPMTKAVSRYQRPAVLCLLVLTFGTVAVGVGEAFSPLWPLAALGAAACLIGITGLCIFVYRVSRETGNGALRSLRQTLRAAIQLLFDLP
jgi:hypothetical protein